MAEEEQEDSKQEQEPLTEEQRITRLEKKVGTNKIVLLSIVLFLIIVITIFITVFTLQLMNKSDAPDQAKDTASSQEFSELKQELEDQKEQVAALTFNLSEIEGKLSNSSNTVIQSVLIEQEQGNQKFLSTLRSGVYDLARMVPGSRTWLELYSEQIDQTIDRSKAREQSLEKLKSSEPVTNEDPFFGNDF